MHALTGADLEGRRAPVRGEISYFSMLLMMEALNFAPFNTFMELYAPSMNLSMNFEVSYDTYHEFKLSIHDVLENDRHITSDNFPDVEDPELVGDDPETPLPGNQWQGRVNSEYKGSIETLSCENKHIILESEADNLVECTLQWLRMCNKNVQRKIMERVVKKEAKDEKKEEEIHVEEQQQDTQEPHVPPPAQVNMECQTEESSLTDSKHGSSFQKEEPVPPERSSEKEESGEKKTDIQHDDTASEEKPATRRYYGQDITGNEDDSVFRKLKECFTDGYHGEWAGFYNQGYPASSRHRPMFWHVKYRKTMSFHQNYWYHLTDDQLMAEHIARHKNQQPLLELEDDVLEDAAPVTRPEDRHGQFLIRQLPHEHQRLLHEITLSSMHALTGADLEGRRAPVRGEISYFSMLLMMEALNFAPFNTFMELYAPSMNLSMNFEVSYDTYHELKLSIHDVLENNRHITSDNVPDVEDPELVGDDPETPLPGNQWQGRVDPEYKGSIETLSCENKHIILESEDDNLVECTLQWLRMCNKNVQRKIMERVVKKEAKDEKKEEEIDVEEQQQDTQEPHVPPPAQVNMECQTEESSLTDSKHGSSFQKEEPVPERSSEKRGIRGKENRHST